MSNLRKIGGDVYMVLNELITGDQKYCQNFNIKRTFTFLSMIHIISPMKPKKVELTVGDIVFARCNSENIFEETIASQTTDDDKIIQTKKWKVLLFGRDGNINLRRGNETEYYYFPLEKLKYQNIKVLVTFEDKIFDSMPFLEFNKKSFLKNNILSIEYWNQIQLDFISLLDSQEHVLRLDFEESALKYVFLDESQEKRDYIKKLKSEQNKNYHFKE